MHTLNWRIRLLALSFLTITSCAARERARQEEQAQIDAAEHALTLCVLDYVKTTPAPRLTATEIAEASIAVCGKRITALRQVFIDLDIDRVSVERIIRGVIEINKQTALAALAQQAAPAPSP